ncbi:hypothetical protein NW768_008360 [Fusarium equiseti]|uniref:Uncharacterized protein n=1 Tax=Fusarium equiseti TaxID=61235 RepID=A0ABQ8R6U3_FUSEQ|nr:hypothetical protein NW768_008360 [Fusarium equiseti]
MKGARVEDSYARLETLLYIQCIDRLPALEYVRIEFIKEYQLDNDFFVPRTGTMAEIALAGCDISDHVMATIISIPEALQEYKVSVGALLTTDGGTNEYQD